MADKIVISSQKIGASAEEGKTKLRGDRGRVTDNKDSVKMEEKE